MTPILALRLEGGPGGRSFLPSASLQLPHAFAELDRLAGGLFDLVDDAEPVDGVRDTPIT